MFFNGIFKLQSPSLLTFKQQIHTCWICPRGKIEIKEKYTISLLTLLGFLHREIKREQKYILLHTEFYNEKC